MAARVAQRLAAAGIENAEQESNLIIAHVTNERVGEMLTRQILGKTLSSEQENRVENIVSEREDRVPLQHLTGKAAFRSIELDVGPGVFIPRPETEFLTQLVIDEVLENPAQAPLVVEFCAGSAAISLAIVNEITHAEVIAVELETNAHAWAERNVQKIGQSRVQLLQADVTEPISDLQKYRGQVVALVSNPPYIPAAAIPKDIEVREHDPATALYGGEDGLDIIRAIAITAHPLLQEGGLIALEHAEMQGEQVRQILLDAGWKSPKTHQDLTRRDRVTTARA